MKLSEDLAWRGLIKDKTFDEIGWLDKPRVFYHGVDASSASMTIGNLAAMLMSRRLIDGGWKAVILAGGATSLIGDPGGKTQERELKPRQEIQNNVKAIKTQINGLFAGKDFILVDNYDWFKDVGYLDFLRDVGKNYSMTELMQREFVTERMGEVGSGISYAEFSYSLVQGYDYWQLFKQHSVVLQIGGSDQWGNMLSGVALIRKKESTEVQALSMPLIVNKNTGDKFGKSEDGAVWLDPAKTSPTRFYQFWINVDDAEVEEYLKVFTFLPREEIVQVMTDHRSNPAARKAQTILAKEVTKIVHGEDSSGYTAGLTKYLTYSTGSTSSPQAGSSQAGQDSIGHASEQELELIRKEIPATKVSSNGSIIQALVKTGLASSNSSARRLLSSGAIYINGKDVQRENFKDNDFINGRLLLRRGKAYKDSALIEIEQ